MTFYSRNDFSPLFIRFENTADLKLLSSYALPAGIVRGASPQTSVLDIFHQLGWWLFTVSSL